MFNNLFCHFRPIFIVNTVQDSDNDGRNGTINEIEPGVISQHADMEINNNSPYLHEKCEDKGDKSDKRPPCEMRISQSLSTVARSLRYCESSQIEIKTMCDEQVMITSNSDIDESPKIAADDELTSSAEVTGDPPESSESKSATNCRGMIKNDIEASDEVNQQEIKSSKAPLIIQQSPGMTQSSGESDVYLRNRTTRFKCKY